MNKILSCALVFSVGAAPALAWGWGDGECPYSKEKTSQEKSEQVEESDK